jgi:hypothetical protein
MTDMKSLCKKATRFNKRERTNSRQVSRKFTKQIGRYQSQCAKMGRIIEVTSREIKEEQAEIQRIKEEKERLAKEAEEERTAKKAEELRKLREKV